MGLVTSVGLEVGMVGMAFNHYSCYVEMPSFEKKELPRGTLRVFSPTAISNLQQSYPYKLHPIDFYMFLANHNRDIEIIKKMHLLYLGHQLYSVLGGTIGGSCRPYSNIQRI